MWAKGFSVAPQMDTRTEPVRASEATPELVAPELQAKMVAAFERGHERACGPAPRGRGRLGQRLPDAVEHQLLLVLERERQCLRAPSGHYWRRRDRYRDLILATKLIHVRMSTLPDGPSRAPTHDRCPPVAPTMARGPRTGLGPGAPGR